MILAHNMLDQLLHAQQAVSVHPNGFLTIDIPGQDARLHLWDSDLPRQIVSTPIHDHLFDMTSYVLAGSIRDRTYQIVDRRHRPLAPPFRTHYPDRDGNLRAKVGGMLEYLELTKDRWHNRGGMYVVPMGILHESSVVGPAATLMYRTRMIGRGDGMPRVMVPHNVEPDNDFKRDAYDQSWLRERAVDIFQRAYEASTA